MPHGLLFMAYVFSAYQATIQLILNILLVLAASIIPSVLFMEKGAEIERFPS